MTLLVETGLASSLSESYISVADADTYHANRGNTAWADYDVGEQKEPALRKATDYMLQVYRLRWKGERMLSTQALDWPRYDVTVGGHAVDSDSVPVEVQRACAMLALRAVGADLSPDLERTIKQETVGPLTTVYADGAADYVRYRDVDNLLAPLLRGGGGSIVLERG